MIIGIAGCTCATDNNTTKEIDPTLQTSLRVFNFSIGTGTLQLNQNDRRAIENIGYGDLNIPYKTMPSGVRNLRLFNGANNAVYGINANLSPNLNYSLFLIDTVGRVSGLLLKDIPPTLLPENEVFIRFVHGGTKAGRVEVFVGEQPTGTPIISDIGFGAFSDYIRIGTGSTLLVRISRQSGFLDVPIPSTTFVQGNSYTIVLYGNEGSVSDPLTVRTIR